MNYDDNDSYKEIRAAENRAVLDKVRSAIGAAGDGLTVEPDEAEDDNAFVVYDPESEHTYAVIVEAI